MRRDSTLRAAAGGVAATGTAVTMATIAASTVLARTGVATPPGPGGITLVVLAVTLALWPEYAPRPRRIRDRLTTVAARVGLAIGALAFAGFLGTALVPAPVLLVVVGATTAVMVPVLLHERRRVARPQRVVLAGDDAGKLGDSVAALETSPLGHVSPPRLSLASAAPDSLDVDRLRTDGGVAPQEEDEQESDAVRQDPSITSGDRTAIDRPSTERISGLSQLRNVLVSRDVDTVVLCFSVSDRQEFFGALRICREHGVDTKVHAFHAPATLLGSSADAPMRNPYPDGPMQDEDGGEAVRDGGTARPGIDVESDERAVPQSVDRRILDANLEPLPLHSRVAKRGFDVCFATAGLVTLAPLLLVIAVAIRLDSQGPVLYGQPRTARLGREFTLWKFRSMTDGAERDTGPTLSDEDAGDVDARVTRVGSVLRTTHLDEIPQLLSVLAGDMTVVGPRPERPELEAEITDGGIEWERRWFVKPGLTGLAQVNEVTGFRPEKKLAYDLEYVERQSLAFDVRIVLAQLHLVFADVVELVRSGDAE